MGVNHRRADIGMAQQLLHCADVVTGQQQVGGKRVSQRVRRGRLVDTGAVQGPLEGALKRLVNLMVTP